MLKGELIAIFSLSENEGFEDEKDGEDGRDIVGDKRGMMGNDRRKWGVILVTTIGVCRGSHMILVGMKGGG